MPPVLVPRDPLLVARILRRTPITYRAGPDPALDRPAHVRAASALAWIGGRLVVVQDDANFLALLDPLAAGRSEGVVLPAGHEGKRQFDAPRGNKAHKLDLESCVTVTEGGEELCIAFGSGSTRARERILVARDLDTPAPSIELVAAPALYAGLRNAHEFAGTELNIEGAVLFDEADLRLFGRGNGAARDGRTPVNASCTLDWRAFRAYLGDSANAPPEPRSIQRYELGSIDGVPLGFTDAIAWGDGVLFSAAAEASPDAVEDGRVAGSVIGVIPAHGPARSILIVGEGGAPFAGKIEGLATGPDDRTLYAVADEDDPAKPSELCEVDIAGLRAGP